MNAPYEAVVLAAGRGSRLSTETEDPKSLLPIGARSLTDSTPTSFLQRHLDILRAEGVERVTIVVGYERSRIIAQLKRWADWVTVAINPTPEIKTSGSLHSFQFASRSEHGILDGSRQTLLMDADIVFHRGALRRLLDAPERSTTLVCDRHDDTSEEVLVYGTLERPRFQGKGLKPSLVDGEPCLGEATGIVKLAPADHGLVRETMSWLLGDPDAPGDSLAYAGFGPARRATEHEELTQRLMHLGKMRAVTFSGAELPFMEVDTPEEYRELREHLYPQLLEMEAGNGR